MAKLLYKPVSLLAGMLAGMAAGAIFNQVWRLAAGEGEAPEATDADRRWAEVLAAAALHGAIFATVRAAVDRGAAVGTLKLTGTWPGKEAKARPAPGDRAKSGQERREQRKKARK